VHIETISSAVGEALGEPIPGILLVGGMGTRLQSLLPHTPKPLAPVGENPFLEILVLQLRTWGVRRLVMCTGHRAEQIEETFGDGRKWDVNIEYSQELSPLGTAGALRFAKPLLQQVPDFLVLNGDSFLELDFQQFLRFHREHGGLVSMAVRKVQDASRYGTVDLDAKQRVVGFREKDNAGAAGLVNGGVYLFRRDALAHFPDGPASLEKDIFPRLLDHGVYAAEQYGMFIDIGTPEDYARAQLLRQSLCQAALSEKTTKGNPV